MEGSQIYEAICGVMADVGAVKKNKKNSQQNFMYRGIDDVMTALNPAMVKNKVFAVPEVTEEVREERQTQKGGVLFYARLKITYRFYTVDGSFVEAKVIGEAMDSGDKATNKAMSIAYKYACFQVFSIPTEDIAEPDNVTHEDVQPLLVDEIKIKVLRDLMTKKGVKEEQLLSRYGVEKMEDLTVVHFMKACKSLEKTPDVAESNVDLGL